MLLTIDRIRNGTFSRSNSIALGLFTLEDEIRRKGQKSKSSKMNGRVTSIGFAIRPSAKVVIVTM